MVGGSTISGVRLSERCSTSRQTTSSTVKVTKKAAAVQTCFTVASFHAEVDHQDVHIAHLFQLESGGRRGRRGSEPSAPPETFRAFRAVLRAGEDSSRRAPEAQMWSEQTTGSAALGLPM